MKRILILLLGLLAVWSLSPLRADGTVWPGIGYAKMQIPDQRALIHYTNGVERLVIETSFVGPGTNFAWVVPLPAVPTIEPVSSAVFTTLPVIFQPKVFLEVGHYWIVAGLIGFSVWLIVCLAARETSMTDRLLLLLLGFVIYGMLLLPALWSAASRGKAGVSTAAAFPSVQVLQRQRVGVFDTVTLTAKDPAALTSWLTTNGFATPTNATPVIADYVKDGWVFVAARVARSTNTTESTSPHPLSFTFKTRKPVYPLRLTGVDNGSCTIDLYVFGPQRAEAWGFEVKRCARPTYHEVFNWPRFEGGKVRVRHTELAGLVNGAPAATKLTGTLTPAHMKRDAYLRWVPYRSQGAALYQPTAAITLAGNVASFALLLSALGLWFVYRPLTRQTLSPLWFVKLMGVSFAVGVITFLVTPRAASGEIEVTRHRGSSEAKLLSLSLRIAITDENLGQPSADDLSRLVKELGPYYWGEWRNPRPVRNPFTGEPLRIEKSPGNIWLQPATNGLEMIWFDFDGAPGFTNEVF
jgi:hypothetical protein